MAWTPWDWMERHAEQQPDWPDPLALETATKELSTFPPLVYPNEIAALKDALAQVSKGKAFVLQAGDCAESFHDHSAASVRRRLKVILQMAVVLTYSSGVPVVKVGRIAGQYAKPRSSPMEKYKGVDLPSFRGHIIHDDAFDPEARRPDPTRLLEAYNISASTLNLLRSLTRGGFADLSQVHNWNQEFVATSSEGERYDTIASEITRALKFMAACGIDLADEAALGQVDFWTSHEALLLHYESALTHKVANTELYYDLSAHMIWIGERTRQVDSAHVRYASGVSNPVGCKVSPKISIDELLELCAILDPKKQPGRLTLISRMGRSQIEKSLPDLVEAVRNEGYPVIWSCDPMHGNTFVSDTGYKTRRFEDVLEEIRLFFEVHKSIGTWAGGVHIELTGDDVTECLGGSEEVLLTELDSNYNTICDPRLNARQSLDLAYRVAELLIG